MSKTGGIQVDDSDEEASGSIDLPQPEEITPLLQKIKKTLKELYEEEQDTEIKAFLKQILDKLGTIITALAMAGQGGFAGLLMIKIIKNAPNTIKLPIGLIIGFAAFLGKYKLVRFFNKDVIKNLVYLSLSNFHPRNWTLGKIINYLMTIHISIVFGGLSNISFDQIGKLLDEYPNQFASVSSDVITHPAFKALPAASAIASNILGYTNIHLICYRMLVSQWFYVLENPKFRRIRVRITSEIENAGHDLLTETRSGISSHIIHQKKLENLFNFLLTYEQKGKFKLRKVLATIIQNPYIRIEERGLLYKTLTKPNGVGLLPTKQYYDNEKIAYISAVAFVHQDFVRQGLLALNDHNLRPPRSASWLDFLASHGIAIAATTLAGVGLFNFIGITAAAYNSFIAKLISSWALGIPTFISILALAIDNIYPMSKDIMQYYTIPLIKYIVTKYILRKPTTLKECGFRYNHEVILLSKKQTIYQLLKIIIVCILGGMPNVFQSLLIGEQPFFEICAELASAGLEAYTFWLINKVLSEVAIAFNIKPGWPSLLNPLDFVNYGLQPNIIDNTRAQLFLILKGRFDNNPLNVSNLLNKYEIAKELHTLNKIQQLKQSKYGQAQKSIGEIVSEKTESESESEDEDFEASSASDNQLAITILNLDKDDDEAGASGASHNLFPKPYHSPIQYVVDQSYVQKAWSVISNISFFGLEPTKAPNPGQWNHTQNIV